MNNPKNSPELNNLPQRLLSSNSMSFSVVIDALNAVIQSSKENETDRETQRETAKTCQFCKLQKDCFLRKSAANFAGDLVYHTEQTEFINIREPLYLFISHACNSFLPINDPLIPKIY